MRPHGRASISARHPRALAVCQRCGFMYNLDQLKWQWDWQFGPRLRNLMIQVCPTCLDVPQESGRTIVLPPDPVPVAFPLPENYARADNPLSYLGYNVANNFVPGPLPALSGNIGSMRQNAGLNAAFDSATNKRAEYCAALAVSVSSFQNTVGKRWNPDPSGTSLTLPSTVAQVTHALSSVTLYAPNDRPFLNSPTGVTGYRIEGSPDNGTWTTLISGMTAGGIGEIITASTTSAAFYPYHRVALEGDGFSAVAIAQAVINVSDAAPNDI
jgi:hypothetical protein